MKNTPCAIALFSGGLDSILACRVIASQGIRVQAVKFVTPFFDDDILKDIETYQRTVHSKYGIDVIAKDITESYIELLNNPPHGFGKNFNPCIDCKILMVHKAVEMMDEIGASFVITGEVVGQRPMSQRKDTLRVIERDSLTDGILLRPLCAKNLPPTQPEIDGIVDREQLHSFSGRGRSQQIELAKSFGITDYPNPAGGCKLTDPNLSKRIKAYYNEAEVVNAADIRFLLVGRQFRLPGGGWVSLGRQEDENIQIAELCIDGDILLNDVDWPGPTALLRHCSTPEDIKLAAALVARFGRKKPPGQEDCQITVTMDNQETILSVLPIEDTIFTPWQLL
ncbi:MAG: thiamine biosynthesis protein [Desulfobulbaceae bacterium]|uniref:Thiamine biosynthesis protein n=1 Tax=Candidatus Desulfobia pelagia TaxID=2841692 RepID=A0A8J6TES4_9BACT|nr:thiamine biosynthesis protein [Candidatus Desulfobia pelagia]